MLGGYLAKGTFDCSYRFIGNYIAVPSLSISNVKGQTGQTTFYTQGNLVVQVICQNLPTNWQTSQQYTVTFQIMKNGTVNLNNDNNLFIAQHPAYAQDIPNGNVTVDAKITTWVMQSGSGSGYSYAASGSVMEGTDQFTGAPTNSTETGWDIVLPQDNQWHTLGTETCYYQPSTLQYPTAQLTQVAIQFSVNVYADVVDSVTPTPPPNGGATMTFTYQGANEGYSQTQIPIYYSPIATASPTLSPTTTPTVAPTQAPTQQPQNTNPTPSAPEFPTTAGLVIFFVLSLFAVTVITMMKRKTNKR